MMVNRRHAEDTLAAQLERTDLQNHGQRFDGEYSADKEEQNILLDDRRDHAERSAQGKRADIAHENFGGMRVVPEKSQRSSDQRSAQDSKFTDARDVLNLEIRGPAI